MPPKKKPPAKAAAPPKPASIEAAPQEPPGPSSGHVGTIKQVERLTAELQSARDAAALGETRAKELSAELKTSAENNAKMAQQLSRLTTAAQSASKQATAASSERDVLARDLQAAQEESRTVQGQLRVARQKAEERDRSSRAALAKANEERQVHLKQALMLADLVKSRDSALHCQDLELQRMWLRLSQIETHSQAGITCMACTQCGRQMIPAPSTSPGIYGRDRSPRTSPRSPRKQRLPALEQLRKQIEHGRQVRLPLWAAIMLQRVWRGRAGRRRAQQAGAGKAALEKMRKKGKGKGGKQDAKQDATGKGKPGGKQDSTPRKKDAKLAAKTRDTKNK